MTKAAELAKMGEVLTNSQIGGRRNMVINGAMQVAQRSTSVTGLGGTSDTGYQTVDRFRMTCGSTAGRFTQSQVADVHDGFAYALKLDCTTADTSIAAGESTILETRFEGQNLQQLKKGTSDAEKFTVSFYVKGNGNATYTCELRDQDNARNISQEFAVTSSWNRIILTFNNETSNALDNDNASSMVLNIWLHAGSNFTSGTHAVNTWHTTNANRLSDSQSSFFSSTDNTFFITGLQLEVGSQATPFEHRSFGEELNLCRRYTYVFGTSGNANEVFQWGAANGTGTMTAINQLPTKMRTQPTLTATASDFQVYNFADAALKDCSGASLITSISSEDLAYIDWTCASMTNAAFCLLRNDGTVNRVCILSAEL
jgi:hypothetical protein